MSAWDSQTGMNGTVRSYHKPKAHGLAKPVKRKTREQRLDPSKMTDEQLQREFYRQIGTQSTTDRWYR